MSGIDSLASQLQKTITEKDKNKIAGYDTKATVVRVSDNQIWVKIPGGVDETPVDRTVACKEGDIVQVRVSGHRAWITGNYTAPATDDTRAIIADSRARAAEAQANSAIQDAIIAHAAADIAAIAADEAMTSAGSAIMSAMDAKKSARDADEAIYGTISYRYTHEVGGQSVTEIVYQRIDGTYYYLDGDDEVLVPEIDLDRDSTDAIIVVRDENGLDSDLRAAVAMVTDIRGYAEETHDYAVQTANTAGSAIGQLGEVEKVIQTLSWIREHGEYSLTTDTEVQNGKWYFEYNPTSNSYELANPSPNDNPTTLGLYELTSVDESVSNYLSTHLALSSDALWVQMDESAYRLKISANGIYLCNEIGDYIAQYTSSVILGNQNGAHIELDPQTGLGFYENATNRVAYIDSNKLFITNAEITENLRIGKFLWKLQGANRISFVYSP